MSTLIINRTFFRGVLRTTILIHRSFLRRRPNLTIKLGLQRASFCSHHELSLLGIRSITKGLMALFLYGTHRTPRRRAWDPS